jgi:hypothetical protein
MPKLFISYARDDLPIVQKLEQTLVAHGTAVWRDQASIYGGQQWPKAMGEAIAAHDGLVLIWSKHAAASHFVEFEWNTAVALQKTILPCLLDETPLPPALRAINGIDIRVFDHALPKILQVVQRLEATANATHSTDVLEQLRDMAPVEPEQVAQAVRTIWTELLPYPTRGERDPLLRRLLATVKEEVAGRLAHSLHNAELINLHQRQHPEQVKRQ